MKPTVFVCDASIQGEGVGKALRAAGYNVVDVPLALLVSRAAAQLPALVIVDTDAPDALEVIARLREMPGSAAIELIFLGEPERSFSVMQTTRCLETADGFFAPRKHLGAPCSYRVTRAARWLGTRSACARRS
ncbi:MAG: hypothetical protein U0165_20360 [Polyangiaceae bacterium]